MKVNDIQEAPVVDTLRDLPAYDVRLSHAQRLRARCHSGLAMQDSSTHLPRSREAGVRRRAVHVLAGAWCVLYVFETIRRAAAVYGF